MVTAQGGDLDAFERRFAGPVAKFCVQAPRSGHVAAIDAEKVARVALKLGAGREKAGDRIDPRAGVTLAVRLGDRVATGSPLATLETSAGPEGLESAAAELLKAFAFSADPVPAQPLVLAAID